MDVGIWAVKTHEILEKNKDEIGNWDPCYVLAKNLALFYSPRDLSDVELKVNGIIIWETDFQYSTVFLLWHSYCCLL